jgi:hypothetical protein
LSELKIATFPVVILHMVKATHEDAYGKFSKNKVELLHCKHLEESSPTEH